MKSKLQDEYYFVNNLGKFDAIYTLLEVFKSEKFIPKNEINILLMKILNNNGYNRTVANKHLVNLLLFFNLIEFKNENYYITSLGANILHDQIYKALVLFSVHYPQKGITQCADLDIPPYFVFYVILKNFGSLTLEEIKFFFSHIKDYEDLNTTNLKSLMSKYTKNIKNSQEIKSAEIGLGFSNGILFEKINKKYSFLDLEPIFKNYNIIFPDIDNLNKEKYYDFLINLEKNIISKREKLVEQYIENEIEGKTMQKCVQKIIIGPPGSGKSFYLNQDNTSTTRIVFHPDYENSDFIGCIKPIVKDNTMIYDFVSGPFTKVLIDAYKNSNTHYTLLIEEMTRGNCAAIFGEVFQLLDRDKEGYSQYGIHNDNIMKCLKEEVLDYESNDVKLPPNMSIVGTVNSSDQNVFPMDTAFKRRFDLKYMQPIPSDFKDNDFEILDSIMWSDLCAKINDKICNQEHLTEDKQIGFFFIKKDDELVTKLEKLCIYLWHDVDKFIPNNNEKILNVKDANSFSKFSNKITSDVTINKLFNLEFKTKEETNEA